MATVPSCKDCVRLALEAAKNKMRANELEAENAELKKRLECNVIWEYSEGKEAWSAHLGSICIGNVKEDIHGGTAVCRAFAPNGEGQLSREPNLFAAKSEIEKYAAGLWNKLHGVKK